MAASNPAEFHLSPDQLYSLRRFIARHGFGEPATLLEILDHFACKVEELWPQHPHWTLEEAMEAAHRSFGPAGFYPLAKAFHEATASRYRALFNRSFWKLPRTLAGALSLLCAYGSYWTLDAIAQAQNWLVLDHWSVAAAAAYLLVFGLNLALMWERKPNPFLRSANQATNALVQIAAVLMLFAPLKHTPAGFQAILFMLAVWYLQAKRVLRRTALREHRDSFQQVYGTA